MAPNRINNEQISQQKNPGKEAGLNVAVQQDSQNHWPSSTVCRGKTAKPKRPPAKSTFATKVMRSLMAPDYGYWNSNLGTPMRPKNTVVLNHFLGQAKNPNQTFAYEISNGKLLDHFSGEATFYYTANPLNRHLLLMLDIDVQKRQKLGTSEGAWDFAEHCRDLFADFEGRLYLEPSTGGKGVHGYFFLDTHVVDDGSVFLSHGEIKSIANRLERYLDGEAKRLGFDVEQIEVKGQPPYLERSRGWHGQSSHRIITCGQLAKIPRLLTDDHVQRLLDTTKLTVYGIDVMLSGEQQPARPAINSPKPKRATKRRAKAATDNDSPKQATRQMGSTCTFSQDEIDSYPALTQVFRDMGLDGLDTDCPSYRGKVKSEDFSMYSIAAAKVQSTFKNENERFRQSRIKGLVNATFHLFQGARPFNAARWKVIRNVLASREFIKCIDMRYQYTPDSPGGGFPMCWRLSEATLQLLKRVVEDSKSSAEEKPEAEQPETEQPKAEQPKAEQPRRKNNHSLHKPISALPAPLAWWQKPRLRFVRQYSLHHSGMNSVPNAISA